MSGLAELLAWPIEAPLEPLRLPWLEQAGVEAAILRLDLLDPLISGNKWFKLYGHLQQALAEQRRGLLSLGGPHSNHLHALAAVGQRCGLPTVGLLRGPERDSPTLTDLRQMGMKLHWLTRSEYRERRQAEFWAPWRALYPNYQFIAEGGGGALGLVGCAQITALIDAQLAALGWSDYQQLWLAVGSGTTLAGVAQRLSTEHQLTGVLAVPQRFGVERTLASMLHSVRCAWQLLAGAEQGFARCNAERLEFLNQCQQHSGVPLEPVYLAPLLWTLREQVLAGYLAPGTRLIVVHGGGLQGARVIMAE